MARGRAVSAQVDGAAQAAAALGGLGPEVARNLAALNAALTREILSRAAGYAARVGRQQAAAARTLRPSTGRGGGVVLPASPAWNAGAEFGSNAYRQFPRWRGSSRQTAGYFLYPALREVNVMQAYSDLVTAAVDKAAA